MHWSGNDDTRVKLSKMEKVTRYSALCSPAGWLPTLTSQLRVSNAVPLSAAISQTCALHHVTQDVVPLVPLVTNPVHHSIIGCT